MVEDFLEGARWEKSGKFFYLCFMLLTAYLRGKLYNLMQVHIKTV